MMRNAGRLLAVAAALALAACASAPIHYYTLVRPDGGVDASTAAPALAFEVLPVRVPAQVDQPQLVVRDGDQQMLMLQGERWVAPLADELRSALAADLARSLPGRDATGLPDDGQARVRVKLDVRRFESWPGAYARVGATWELRLAHAAPARALTCTSEVREAVGAGYAALVAGHQRAIAALAAEMAPAARALAAGQPASCPAG